MTLIFISYVSKGGYIASVGEGAKAGLKSSEFLLKMINLRKWKSV